MFFFLKFCFCLEIYTHEIWAWSLHHVCENFHSNLLTGLFIRFFYDQIAFENTLQILLNSNGARAFYFFFSMRILFLRGSNKTIRFSHFTHAAQDWWRRNKKKRKLCLSASYGGSFIASKFCECRFLKKRKLKRKEITRYSYSHRGKKKKRKRCCLKMMPHALGTCSIFFRVFIYKNKECILSF